VLSLISWALVIVVTLKYVIVIMRADNRGEGGTLALTALALRSTSRTGRRHRWILAAGLVGGGAVLRRRRHHAGDLGAQRRRGLKIATPVFEPYILPITVVLLLGLFLVQRRGTALVGGFFGPVMAVWFSVLGLLGAIEIVKQPEILWALNPYYGIKLLTDNPWHGFVLLGAVVLAVTGAEALYADMGHFGRVPIRTAWLRLVFPACCSIIRPRRPVALDAGSGRESVLSPGAGLGALSDGDPRLGGNHHRLAGGHLGRFSMTNQAVQLGYLPRLFIRHTSEQEFGQVYVPKVISSCSSR